MKINLIIFLSIVLLFSCKSQETEINLKPELELIDNLNIKFENQTLKYSQLDSILKDYTQNIPPELKDAIRINLEVNSKEVTMQKVSEVKISLRKNKLLKINYKPKNDKR
jgi:hypothetical protein